MTVLDVVVRAFFAVRVARQPAGLAQLFEPVLATGDDLVHVRLVAGVPQNRVGGRVEHSVQRQRQLDGAEVAAQVPGVLGDGLDDEVANLAGEFGQLRMTQFTEVGRLPNLLQPHGGATLQPVGALADVAVRCETMSTHIDGHAGQQAIAAMLAFGTDTMFTLNGGHVWPLYEGARDQGMRVVDTRHEQTATFAAEAYAKLTRKPGFAALTAGPGITNGVSAVTSAWFNGSPLVVMGGRAPAMRWGSGSLQEFDHVPVMQSITKSAATVTDAAKAGEMVHAAARLVADAASRADVPRLSARRLRSVGWRHPRRRSRSSGAAPDDAAVAKLAALIAGAERPAFIVGGDVYWDGAWEALRAAAEELRVPCFFNGLGRGLLPADHELAFLRTRGLLKARADLVVVLGTPLDFRLGLRSFRCRAGRARGRR